jgi:hypothetical protein
VGLRASLDAMERNEPLAFAGNRIHIPLPFSLQPAAVPTELYRRYKSPH